MKMDFMKEILPPKIYETVDRAGICTPKQIITLSIWDIKKLTGLQTKEIQVLRKMVSEKICNKCVPCNTLFDRRDDKLKSGCVAIDNLLNGGFRRGVLIEIYGESGSGKTQLGMHLSANNASNGIVYLCTEDLFPIKRYNQIHSNITQCTGEISNNVFIEHIYESQELLTCIRIRLPKLLQQHTVSLVILDSVAAPFRCETSNYVQRAEELREVAIMLTRIAQDNNLAVVCINQVTANFDDATRKLLPSLGLAWSNMIAYRLWLKKCSINNVSSYHIDKTAMREIEIIFAPDLPNASCNFLINSKGIRDL